jgi:hypothetical protein
VHATGTIRGRVRTGKKSAAFTNVIVVGTRRGAQADEKGSYLLREVPAGMQAVRALLTGYMAAVDSVRVIDDSTVTLDFDLISAEAARPKDWKPPHPPDHSILRRMQEAPTVRLFRLDGRQRGHTRTIGIDLYGQLRDTLLTDRKRVRELVDLLGKKESYDNGGTWNVRKLCTPQPGVGVRFSDAAGAVEVILCYECGMLWVVADSSKGAGGNFDRKGHEFVQWIKGAWPDDPGIQAIRDPVWDSARK